MNVVIVGSAGHWETTDWDVGDEYWGMNTQYTVQPVERFTRWFDLHDFSRMYDDLLLRQEHLEWLRDPPLPVYMWQSQIDAGYSGKPFDPGPLLEEFGRYFTNTVSWLIGFALQEGATTITLRGLDMATEWENRFERPSVEYLLGIARGRGVEIDINPESDLLKTPYLYGLEQVGDVREALRFKLDDYRYRQREYQRSADTLQGAIDNMAYLVRNFYDNETEAAQETEEWL